MNINELINALEKLPDSLKELPIMVEVERDIYLNLQELKIKDDKFAIMSIFPDPFREALKKAGVE